MSFVKFVFDAIDVLCNKDQNGISYGDMEEILDLVYDSSFELGKLDLYAKKFDSSVKHPLIINFHGGGFVAGDKKYRKGLASYFVNKLEDSNIIYLNANYRLCDGKEVKFPTPVIDGANVLKWVEEHKDEYNFDMEHIYLSGDSAGGYMAICMLNLTLDNDYAEKIGAYKPHLKIKGGMFGCGPYDVLTALSTKLYGLNVGAMVGKPLTGVEKINEESIQSYKWLYECNPINYVSKDYPDIFFIHAEHDEFCPGHAKQVVAKLKELGVSSHEYYLSKKLSVNHCFFLSQKSKLGQEALAQVEEYFRESMAN